MCCGRDFCRRWQWSRAYESAAAVALPRSWEETCNAWPWAVFAAATRIESDRINSIGAAKSPHRTAPGASGSEPARLEWSGRVLFPARTRLGLLVLYRRGGGWVPGWSVIGLSQRTESPTGHEEQRPRQLPSLAPKAKAQWIISLFGLSTFNFFSLFSLTEY